MIRVEVVLILGHIERTHQRRELPELFAHTRDNGFDGVEIVFGRGCTCELSEPEESCRGIAEAAARSQVAVRSALLADDPAVRVSSADHEARAQNLERIRDVVHRCRWMGIQTLRLIPAVVGVPPDGIGQPYQGALNETYCGLEALRPEFERCGVAAGVMPCHHGFLLSPPEFRELIDRVNSPLVGAALDWSACARVGEPSDWITTLQHRLGAVSVDARAGCVSSDNDSLSAALRETRFDGLLIHTGETCSAAALGRLRNAVGPSEVNGE